MKVLFITCSMMLHQKPRGSVSATALQKFKKLYQDQHPHHELIDLDLNDLPLAQKTLNAHNMNTYFDTETDDAIEQLKQVHKVVIATPMTNFNYPAVLKNYLDHILQAKKTFIYKYDGRVTSEGLLPHLKVQIIASQGAPLGWYRFGNHVRTLKGTFEFVGARVTKPIIIHGTRSPALRNASVAEILASQGVTDQLTPKEQKYYQLELSTSYDEQLKIAATSF